MRVKNLEGVNVAAAEMPMLDHSDSNGYVLARKTAVGNHLFEECWLKPEVGTRNGDYRSRPDLPETRLAAKQGGCRCCSILFDPV